MIYLDAPSLQDCLEIAKWRNGLRQTLRTPGMTTLAQQEHFYNEVVNSAKARYYAIREETLTGGSLVAFGGFCPLDHINRSGEISLIVNPDSRKHGYGKESLLLLLQEGFWNLNLHIVYGEAYWCNPDLAFWQKMVKSLGGHQTTVPDRKFWDGRYWDSCLFTFTEAQYALHLSGGRADAGRSSEAEPRDGPLP